MKILDEYLKLVRECDTNDDLKTAALNSIAVSLIRIVETLSS